MEKPASHCTTSLELRSPKARMLAFENGKALGPEAGEKEELGLGFGGGKRAIWIGYTIEGSPKYSVIKINNILIKYF